MRVHLKALTSYGKLSDLVSKFTNVTRHKANAQKLVIFLYSKDKKWKMK